MHSWPATPTASGGSFAAYTSLEYATPSAGSGGRCVAFEFLSLLDADSASGANGGSRAQGWFASSSMPIGVGRVRRPVTRGLDRARGETGSRSSALDTRTRDFEGLMATFARLVPAYSPCGILRAAAPGCLCCSADRVQMAQSVQTGDPPSLLFSRMAPAFHRKRKPAVALVVAVLAFARRAVHMW